MYILILIFAAEITPSQLNMFHTKKASPSLNDRPVEGEYLAQGDHGAPGLCNEQEGNIYRFIFNMNIHVIIQYIYIYIICICYVWCISNIVILYILYYTVNLYASVS